MSDLQDLIVPLVILIAVLIQGVGSFLKGNYEKDEDGDVPSSTPPIVVQPKPERQSAPPVSPDQRPVWEAVSPDDNRTRPAPKRPAPKPQPAALEEEKPINVPAQESPWGKILRELLDADEVFVEEEPPRPKKIPRKPKPEPKPQSAAAAPSPTPQPIPIAAAFVKPATVKRAYPAALARIMKNAEKDPVRAGIIFSEIIKPPPSLEYFGRIVKP
ncbi:MAG: hypothetical protein AB1656_09610 [Candidatus Omnitrophota bacterium]